MASKDPLDNEISISGELTESGVKAKAKSRAISGFDRLVGNVFDLANAKMERIASRDRATAAAEKKVIEAQAKKAVEQIGSITDEDSKRALLNHFSSIFREQVNKDAVVREAIEDLRENPPSEAEAASGPEELSEAFINRAEQYARFASTDELRQRWGRVIAAEVRKPGTFSEKVLRVVDELESDTAQLFEKLCQSRIRDGLPKTLVGKLPFRDVTALTTAGLLVDPGVAGQIRYFSTATDVNGADLWTMFGDGYGIAFSRAASIPDDPDENAALKHGEGGKPVVPVYVITSAGVAICSILPDTEEAAVDRITAKINSALPNIGLRKYQRRGDQFYLVQGWAGVSTGGVSPAEGG